MSIETRVIAPVLTGPAERQRVLALLRNARAGLRALGIERLSLFGSVARGEANSDSDVDLLVELAPNAELSLLDLVAVQHDLEQLIGRRVEIAEPGSMRAWLREWIEPERLVVM